MKPIANPSALARICCATLLLAALSQGVASAAAEGGAESPEALMQKIAAAAEVQDVAVVVSCIAPADRPFLAFMLGMISVEMVGFHIMELTGEGANPSREMKAKAAQFHEGYNELLTKYELVRFNPVGVDMNDPIALAKIAEESLASVDHAAFIGDSIAFLDGLRIGAESDGQNPLSRFNANVEDIDTDGDRARVKLVGVDRRVELTRQDARWYLLLIPEQI